MIDIGVRREDKNRWERRVPLTPHHVEELVSERKLKVAVQPSTIRVFSDEEYAAAGALVQEDLSPCRVVIGVKEVPIPKLIPGMAYTCFSHVIKGQSGNMPMLRKILELKNTLIDYEPIVDRTGKRLLFFGRHAGFAGMIDALWALGERLGVENIENAFQEVRPAHTYRNLDEALEVLSGSVSQRIRERGIHPDLHPLVIGFCGGGNVSSGAQEILDRLPVVDVHPEELAGLASQEGLSRRAVYKVVFRREHRKNFARHLPFLTMMVNGIYWEPGDRRLVTREDVAQLWSGGQPKLRILADLSCDIEGSVEVTLKATSPEDPVFVYDPTSGTIHSGVAGHGPVVLAVDNLPAELPRDASEHFGDALFPFISGILAADYRVGYEHLTLPAAVLRGVIAHGGELTPRYQYLEDAMRKAGV